MNIIQKHKHNVLILLLIILTITTTSLSTTYANRLYFGQNNIPQVKTNESSHDIIIDSSSNVQSETSHVEIPQQSPPSFFSMPRFIGGKGITIHSPLPQENSITIELDTSVLTSNDLREGADNPYLRSDRVRSIISEYIKAGTNTSITSKDGHMYIESLQREAPGIQPLPEPVTIPDPVEYTAGNGLILTDTTFAVALDTSALSFSPQGITISDTWAGSAALSQLGTVSQGTWQGSPIGISYGGTGATTAADARANLGLVTGGSGDIWVDTAGDTVTGSLLFSPASDVTAVTIKARTGQTTPLQSWTSTTGIVLTSVTKEGFIDLSNAGNTGDKTLIKLSNRSIEGYGSGFNKSNGNEFFNMVGGTSDNTIFGGGVNGDTIRRFRIIAAGELLWGSGQDPQDTKLRRYSATDGGLLVVSNNVNVNQIPLSIKAAPSQVANIQQWINGSGLPLAYITARGGAVFNDRSTFDADFQVKGDTDVNLFYVDASADKIGIGTATPSGGKMHISISSGKGLYIANTGTGNSIEDDSGAKLTANGVWTDTSDLTKKENIAMLAYGLQELLQLKPVSYSWKNTNVKDIGFIAQDVKEIIPELVYGSEGDYSLSYGHMTALLTKSIQEQQAQITRLSMNTSADTNPASQDISFLKQSTAVLGERISNIEQSTLKREEIASFSAQLSTLESSISGLLRQTAIASVPAVLQTLPPAATETASSLDSLIVANHTVLNTVGITGTVTSGLLSINGMTDQQDATIETLSGTLHLQKNSLNDLAFMNAKVTIQTDGSVQINQGRFQGNPMIRGINLPVPSTSQQIEVTFPTPRPSSAYAVSVTPQWNTNAWVESKSENGFIISFSTTPQNDSFLDWIIVD